MKFPLPALFFKLYEENAKVTFRPTVFKDFGRTKPLLIAPHQKLYIARNTVSCYNQNNKGG
jgi:hypothetical protein